MHSVDQHKDQSADRRERTMGAALLVLGLLVAGGALVKIQKEETFRAHVAQAQTVAPDDQTKPAQSEPGGARPTTPAPEPARPQVKPGETSGTAPATTPSTGTPLPPAPAEKVAPPIDRK
jgi:hypothetical protein